MKQLQITKVFQNDSLHFLWIYGLRASAIFSMNSRDLRVIAGFGAADPAPTATAPARIHSATLLTSTPPVGIGGACGNEAMLIINFIDATIAFPQTRTIG